MPAEGGTTETRESRRAVTRWCSRAATAAGDRARATCRRPTLVIAADSGLGHALALGVRVDLVVGDLDSVDPTTLDAAVAAGATDRAAPRRQGRHRPRARARRRARPRRRRGRAWSVAAAAGSTTSSPTCCCSASPALRRRRASRRGSATRDVIVVRDQRRARTARPATLVLAAPVGGPAAASAPTGLRWPLRRRDAPPGLDPRRQQRDPRHHRRRLARPTACSSPSLARLRKGQPEWPMRRRPRRPRSPVVAARGRARRQRPRAAAEPTHDHARHPRLVRGVEGGAARVHEADRHQGEGPAGRRRRRRAQPGDPHQGRTRSATCSSASTTRS